MSFGEGRAQAPLKVLITGVDGYIGSLLAPYMSGRGHEVVGLDTGFYREGWLYSDGTSPDFPRVMAKDVRRVETDDLTGCQCVVHLAELSNDPLGELQPEVTHAINHHASTRLATLAKEAGVQRFVYASSCAVYGAGRDDVLTEESASDPQTAYARCKMLVETDLKALAGERFSPVCLRNATAFGASPRMRFDIVLNNLAGLAHTVRRIAMTSDGTPWRPLVHVLDICRAIACAVEAPASAVHGETFNVGDNRQNYQVRDIAGIVADAFPGCELTFGPQSADRRSYRVSFDKISRSLPGFRCLWDAHKGAAQLQAIFRRIDLTADRFEFRSFTRLEALKYLLRTQQIDRDLFWTS